MTLVMSELRIVTKLDSKMSVCSFIQDKMLFFNRLTDSLFLLESSVREGVIL